MSRDMTTNEMTTERRRVRLILLGLLLGVAVFGYASLSATAAEEDAKDPLENPELIAQGKTLFTAKICSTCHQVDANTPAPAGDALKATKFMGKFWGEKRTVTKGPGGEEMEVVFDAPYVDESIAQPMAKIVKGAVPGMAPLPTTPEERKALTAYVKSLSE